MDFIECNEYFGSWYPGDAAEVRRSLDEIHAAFPDKPIVISEYGYCACTADRPEGDERRREILRTHDEVFREQDYMAGLIFFCYNDYRTHIGDRGTGVMRQRVHGVVDVCGNRKASYDCCAMNRARSKQMQIEGPPDGVPGNSAGTEGTYRPTHCAAIACAASILATARYPSSAGSGIAGPDARRGSRRSR